MTITKTTRAMGGISRGQLPSKVRVMTRSDGVKIIEVRANKDRPHKLDYTIFLAAVSTLNGEL